MLGKGRDRSVEVIDIGSVTLYLLNSNDEDVDDGGSIKAFIYCAILQVVF